MILPDVPISPYVARPFAMSKASSSFPMPFAERDVLLSVEANGKVLAGEARLCEVEVDPALDDLPGLETYLIVGQLNRNLTACPVRFLFGFRRK